MPAHVVRKFKRGFGAMAREVIAWPIRRAVILHFYQGLQR